MQTEGLVIIEAKADEELTKLEQEYKRKRKEINRKKNLDMKKYKHEQALMLGQKLCCHYETYDAKVILEKLGMEHLTD